MGKLFFVIVIMLNLAWAGISIKGTVTGADGNVPEIADVHISQIEGSIYNPLKSVSVDKTGAFSLDVESGKYYNLYITAPDHYGFEMPLFIDGADSKIIVDVRLEGYTLEKSFDNVKIIGDWNNFKFRSADDMQKQADGTYLFEYKTDQEKVAYQLVNVETSGHSVNGTMHDELVYDGGGDYRSVVKVANGVAKIIFDPAKLLRSTDTDLPKAKFSGNNYLSTLLSISQKFSAERSAYFAEKDKNPKDDNFKYNWSNFASFLENKMDDESTIVRRYAASKYLSLNLYGFENAKLNRAIELLPLSDPLWVLNAYSVNNILSKIMGDKKAGDYINKNFSKIPSKKVQAAILAMQGIEAKNNDQMEKVAELFTILSTEYKDVKDGDRTLSYYIGQLDPGNTIAKGKPVPHFEVKLIHSDETVTNESMLGKYYLMDFWAVWCAPCRAEMPKIHEAFKEFSSDKFTILSLSFDPKVDAVDKYRKETWAMPWLHTFVEGGFNNDLSQRFEVTGIPKPLLVNPQGIIVATGVELRGENLKATLNKYLNTTM